VIDVFQVAAQRRLFLDKKDPQSSVRQIFSAAVMPATPRLLLKGLLVDVDGDVLQRFDVVGVRYRHF
jgi:hypothetical protein